MDDVATRYLQELAAGEGALVGFADLGVLPLEARLGLPRGVVFAMPIRLEIVAALPSGPDADYELEYRRLNDALTALAERCAGYLREQGFRAEARQATPAEIDRATLATALPHKTVATRAGVGWVGKSALLVTPAYGSAVRLSSVLTDAPLLTGMPIDRSLCEDECRECVEACPGNAPTGAPWRAGKERADLYDAFACARTARQLSAARGIPHFLCGRCIAACPWTRQYVASVSVESLDKNSPQA